MWKANLVFGVWAAVITVSYSITCDELPWRTDLNTFAYCQKYSGAFLLYQTLDKSTVCGIGTYFEICPATSLFTLIMPNTCNSFHQYKVVQEEEELHQKCDMATGKCQIRKIFDWAEDENGFGICLFTCGRNGVDYESFDCYVTSDYHTAFVKSAINRARINLRKGQSFSVCHAYHFQQNNGYN